MVSELKFTRLCSLNYTPVTTGERPERKWEMVQRTTRNLPVSSFTVSPAPLPVDAVEVCATLHTGDKKFMVLVVQYRPPLDAVCIEFPAGLVDAGEDPREAAIRELREETGYVVTEKDILSVSPPISPEPGLSDTCCQLVRIKIDGSLPQNGRPKQRLDDGEDIEVLLLEISTAKGALDELTKFVKGKENEGVRTVVDAKLYCYLDALSWT